MARPVRHVVLMAFACLCAAAVPAFASDADVAAVRQARAVMNKLLGAHDMEGFRKWLEENTTVDVMVNAPAWRNAGRDRVWEAYKERTVDTPLRVWDHTPEQITANEVQNFLTERGTYTQVWQGKGVTNRWQGEYLALWKRTTPNGPWLLDAEIFVPMKCTGDDECAPRLAGRASAIRSTVPPREDAPR